MEAVNKDILLLSQNVHEKEMVLIDAYSEHEKIVSKITLLRRVKYIVENQ